MNLPIDTVHLFPVLDKKLITLLRSLNSGDWNRYTLARQWTVKDVAAHLLDGNIRAIAMLRDGYFGETPVGTGDYRSLVNFLNGLNADWVKAMKRVSPPLLISWLEWTGKEYVECLQQLNPLAPAPFAVSWAGENESLTWFHVAREYTEKWHHQQQIREAVNKPGIMDNNLFQPVMQTFMRALPYAYRNVQAPTNTLVIVKILNDEDVFTWAIRYEENQWRFATAETNADACITLTGDVAWKLFTKGITPAEGMERSNCEGKRELAIPLMELVAVMA